MKLTILERIIIPVILPEASNYVGQILNKSISNKLVLLVEEIDKYEVCALEFGGLKWNEKGKQAEFEITFSEKEFETIKTSINRLDKEEKITKDHVSIYEKFNQ